MALVVPLAGSATPAAAETKSIRERIQQAQWKVLERHLSAAQLGRLKVEPKIIGGDVAPAGRWPFQAGILLASIANNANAQFCGASIIHERFALTAAHCLEPTFTGITDPSQIHVLTNTQDLGAGGTRHQVARYKIHRRWDPETFDYDIAIIKLKNSVSGIPAGKRAQIISSVDEETESAPPRERAYVTGWGDTQPGGGTTFPEQLHEVLVRIIRRGVCNGPDSYDGAITSRMICAGIMAGGKDSCQGDSGGPLVVRDAVGKWRLQVGVVSWGIGCALPDLPGVYSRLGVLGPWVLDTINNLL